MSDQLIISGNSFAPLSYLSFANQDFDSELLPYNPSEDLDQLGEGWEVVPIPFTASPFGLIEQAKSNFGERAELGDRVFDVKTWNPSFVSVDRCLSMEFGLYIMNSWRRIPSSSLYTSRNFRLTTLSAARGA